MAHKFPEQTIPSDFVRLDAGVTDPDAFMNVQVQNKVRLNHNILLAKRIRKNIFHKTFWNGQNTVGSDNFNPCSAVPVDRAGAYVMLAAPIFLSPYTKEVHIEVRAATTVGSSVRLYPTITGPGGQELGPKESNSLLINSGVMGDRSTDYPISEGLAANGSAMLKIAIGGGVTGSVLDGTLTVAHATRYYVEVTTNPSSTTALVDAVYVDTDSESEPVAITRISSFTYPTTGTTYYRIFLAKPLKNTPVPGTDTVSTRAMLQVQVQSVSVYEKAPDEFNDLVEAP